MNRVDWRAGSQRRRTVTRSPTHSGVASRPILPKQKAEAEATRDRRRGHAEVDIHEFGTILDDVRESGDDYACEPWRARGQPGIPGSRIRRELVCSLRTPRSMRYVCRHSTHRRAMCEGTRTEASGGEGVRDGRRRGAASIVHGFPPAARWEGTSPEAPARRTKRATQRLSPRSSGPMLRAEHALLAGGSRPSPDSRRLGALAPERPCSVRSCSPPPRVRELHPRGRQVGSHAFQRLPSSASVLRYAIGGGRRPRSVAEERRAGELFEQLCRTIRFA